MSTGTHKIRIVSLVALCQVLIADDAQAYVDPATGSLLFQMALAFIVGVSIALRTYWHKIRSFFSRRDDSRDAPPDETSPTGSS